MATPIFGVSVEWGMVRVNSLKLRIAGLLLSMPLYFAWSHTAEARVRFGEDHTIHFIQNVDIKGPHDEVLYLGYKITTFYLFAGVYVRDDGYILGIKGHEGSGHFNLTADQIEDYQHRGLLPNPMPHYSISIYEYIMGYLLWIVLFIIGMWALLDRLRRQRRALATVAAPSKEKP